MELKKQIDVYQAQNSPLRLTIFEKIVKLGWSNRFDGLKFYRNEMPL